MGVVRLSMSGMIPFDIAHAEPDGVERGKEGERQHRADGSASDQRISHGLHQRPLQQMIGITILRLQVRMLSVASAIADAL